MVELEITPLQLRILRLHKACYPLKKIAKEVGCSTSNVCQHLNRLQKKYPEIEIFRFREKKIKVKEEEI